MQTKTCLSLLVASLCDSHHLVLLDPPRSCTVWLDLIVSKCACSVPPECLQDKSLGDHEYVTANGIKFHYVTCGDKSKPLMLFLHGFPEVCQCIDAPIYAYVRTCMSVGPMCMVN